MRKLFKKALACCLVAALALTCFVGALTVNAENATGSAVVTGTTVTEGADEATVKVTLTSNDAKGIHAAIVTVSSDFGAITSVVDADETNNFWVDEGDINGNTFLVQARSNEVNATEINLNVTFKAETAPAVGTYPVAITAGTVPAASWDEVVTEFTTLTGADIVVEADEPEVIEPVVDSALKFQGASVGFGTSSLQINFRVRNTVLALYDDMEVVIIPQKYDMTTLNLVAEPTEIVINKADLAAAGSTMKSYLYTDIQLYELGLDIDYMLRAYDAEGNLVAISDTFTTSPATYLKTSYGSSSDAKFRTLVTDTLIVGDEAATNMANSYTDSDLAKATSIIDGFDISEATATVDSYNTVDEFNSYNADYGSTNKATHWVRKSVSIGKVPFITYRVRDTASALDLEKLAFNVSYTQVSADGTETAYNETFTTANGDISVSSGWISFKFDAIGLQDGDKDIFVEVSYDGTVVCDSTYSVETYLGANMSGSLGGLATALIKLGISFRAYSA